MQLFNEASKFNRNHQAFLRISPLHSCQLYHSGHGCSRFSGSWKAQTNGHCAAARSQQRLCPAAGHTSNLKLWILACLCLLPLTGRQELVKQTGSLTPASTQWDGDKYRDLQSLQPECLMEQGGAVRSCHYEEWFLLDCEWIFLAEVFSTSGGMIWKWERVSQRFVFVALPM